jgi:hypothetical protein
MRRIFWGFCRNRFLIDPLQYLSSRSDFVSEFAEIFVIEKRLPDSASRGVGDSPTRLLNVKKKNQRVGDISPKKFDSVYAQSPRKCSNFEILAKIEGKEANFFSKIYQGHIRIIFRLKKIKIISCLCTFKPILIIIFVVFRTKHPPNLT